MIKIILVSIVVLLVAAGRSEGRHHNDKQVQAPVEQPVYQPFSQEQIENTKRKIEARKQAIENPNREVDIDVEQDNNSDGQFFRIAMIIGTVFVISRICVAIRRNNRIDRQLRERSQQQLLQRQPVVMQENIHALIQYHQQELYRLQEMLQQQQPISNVEFQYSAAPQCVEPIVQGYFEPQTTIPVGRPIAPVNRYH